MAAHRIFAMPFAEVYPHYVTKAERKQRTQDEVDQIICWLTGYSTAELHTAINTQKTFSDFFAEAPEMNPARSMVTGVICGVRIEEIDDPLMAEIRRMDKMIEELARGRAMVKILRA